MSEIFTASERDIANISGQYRQFVAQQYQLPLARISFACDNTHIASEAKALASKAADIKRMERDAAFPKTVETGWKGPGAPAPLRLTAGRRIRSSSNCRRTSGRRL